MNMYDWAKEAETLVEVVYPSMDGYIYFYELQTGKATRDALNLGYTFKGTGTLDRAAIRCSASAAATTATRAPPTCSS